MMIFLISFGAGLLAALSPCVLPVVPLIAGSSMNGSKKGPIFIMLGLITSFVVMGLIFNSVAKFVGLSEEHLKYISAGLLLGFGIVLLVPHLKSAMSNRLVPLANSTSVLSQKFGPSGFGQFAIGLLLGMAWSPCVGPTLGIAVGLAGSEESKLMAAAMMTAFGFGLALPLIAISYGFSSLIRQKREWLLRFNAWGTKALGASTALIGFLILTGLDKVFETKLLTLVPDWYLAFSTSI